MKTGILIIVSLILGFFQGNKAKKKKLMVKIKELELENENLNKEKDALLKRKHLLQYSNKAVIKGDRQKLEEELTEISTFSDENKDSLLKIFAFLQFTPMSSETEISKDLIEDLVEADESLDDLAQIYTECNVGNQHYSFMLDDVLDTVKSFLLENKQLDLNQYQVNIGEFMDSVEYVLVSF